MDRPFLLISDTQIPFQHSKALEFAAYAKRHYRVPDENCIHVGDELDQYFGGQWPKDPDAIHSPTGELGASRAELARWYDVFPKMKVCTSNHGIRWMRKASAAEIPSELMRSYREVIQAPDGWIWQDAWVFRDLKQPFRVIHGMGYSGMNGHRTAALDGGISTAIGHLHSHAGISYITTSGQTLWGMNTGSLIDVAAYAFQYGKDSRFKPCIGLGMVFNSGTTPLWLPL